MRVWRKIAAAQNEERWFGRLDFIEPERIAISCGLKSRIRIEVYGVSKNEAARLLREFGGRLCELDVETILKKNAAPGRPIYIRDRLVVVRSERERKKWAKEFPQRGIVVIPAGAAFGTGDHATTASCLRLICDAVPVNGGSWDFLDIGTGTGILAIASKMLGARRVEALDFDQTAVRIARETAVINHVRGVRFQRADVTRWNSPRMWRMVAANVYSEVLISSAAQIAKAVARGGTLILSGILRTQEKDCVAAFSKRGLEIQQTIRNGKWIALMFRKSA